MQAIGCERRPIAFGCDLAVADQQEPMQTDAVAVDALEKPQDGL